MFRRFNLEILARPHHSVPDARQGTAATHFPTVCGRCFPTNRIPMQVAGNTLRRKRLDTA